MDFRSYREREGLSLDDAAKLLGLANGSAVWKHEEGRTMPRPMILDKYVEMTGGEVQPEDFVRAYRARREAEAAKKADIAERKARIRNAKKSRQAESAIAPA